MVPAKSKDYKFNEIVSIKHLIDAIYQEINFLIDLKKVSLGQLYLSTEDGFMIPPYTSVQQIFNVDWLGGGNQVIEGKSVLMIKVIEK